MKVRLGFVANSSSSSFCIGKNYMTKEQIHKFNNVVDSLNEDDCDDANYIIKTDLYFVGQLSDHNKTVKKFMEENELTKFYARIC